LSALTEITTKAEYERVLDREPVFVVLFTQPRTCIPCQQLKPHYESVAEESDILFAYIDVDKAEPELLREYNIMGVPRMFLVTSWDSWELIERSAVKISMEIQSLRDKM
jgi:thiol-disulfide isomerase/thioredoxin